MAKPITQAQLNHLEAVIDKAFGRLGLDVDFTRHFLDRVNDTRNGDQITIQELASLFKKEYMRWGRTIAGMEDRVQAVMKDLASDINLPFVVNDKGPRKDNKVVAKTVMRKPDFKTSSPVLPVESVSPVNEFDQFTQVKGNEPMPAKKKPSNGPASKHPYKGRLVGENAEESTNIVRDFVKQKRREGWSVYASRINHGVNRAHRLEFEKDGIEFEVIGHGNTWELFANGPTLSGRGEEFDGLDAAFQTGTCNESAHSDSLYYVQPDGEWKKGADGRSKGRKRSELPKGAKIAEDAVHAAWNAYKLDERVMDPREAILRKALTYLDELISNDTSSKMDAGGHAFDVARMVNLGMSGRELLNLYKDWKKSSVTEDEQLDEAFNSPYNYKWQTADNNKATASFDTEDDRSVSVIFNKTYPQEYEMMFNVDGSMEVTGGGDQFRIFATVLAVAREFMVKYYPDMVEFSAAKTVFGGSSSRSSLYTRMVEKFADEIGYDFEVTDRGNEFAFVLKMDY